LKQAKEEAQAEIDGYRKQREDQYQKYEKSVSFHYIINRGRRGLDHMVVDLQLPVQSVPITTKVVSLNPLHGEVYLIQHYVIKFVSGFLQVLRFPPPS